MFIVQLVLLNSLFVASVLILLPTHLPIFITLCVGLLWLFYRVLKAAYQRHTQLTTTLEAGFRSLHDGDFSISLSDTKNKQDKPLIDLFNQVTDKLRVEKQTLYQRELLLDKVVNASDVVTVLINNREQIVFANLAAQQFLQTRALIGSHWLEIVANHKPELAPHLSKSTAIFQLHETQNKAPMQSWHLSRHTLRLHNMPHQLLLLKPMTKELQEQELATWKKVIRVINHELNNSIAPISSMCHSGQILAEKLEQPQLDRVFNTISNRIQKLSQFIQNYSQLARLSNPQKHPFDLEKTLKQIQSLYQMQFEIEGDVSGIFADASQIEQLLINLVKNANEVCPAYACEVNVKNQSQTLTITIRDHGPGMSSEVMQKAFTPYYSTKAEGSGIGLSICKEVVDAHNGQMDLSNHAQGGLIITIRIPHI